MHINLKSLKTSYKAVHSTEIIHLYRNNIIIHNKNVLNKLRSIYIPTLSSKIGFRVMAHFSSAQVVACWCLCRTPGTIVQCKACHLNLCKVCVMKHSFHLYKYHILVSLKQDLTGLNCKKPPMNYIIMLIHNI